uniref:Uncharacterized protein n=1 Tax=Trichuris muris TaxID=70415 RepID=A0A5S6QLJ6_TRIMR
MRIDVLVSDRRVRHVRLSIDAPKKCICPTSVEIVTELTKPLLLCIVPKACLLLAALCQSCWLLCQSIYFFLTGSVYKSIVGYQLMNG